MCSLSLYTSTHRQRKQQSQHWEGRRKNIHNVLAPFSFSFTISLGGFFCRVTKRPFWGRRKEVEKASHSPSFTSQKIACLSEARSQTQRSIRQRTMSSQAWALCASTSSSSPQTSEPTRKPPKSLFIQTRPPKSTPVRSFWYKLKG